MVDGPDFVSTNFTFFDCNTFSSCTSCVASPFPCDWCVDGHRCTHDTAENCRNDILVTGIKRVGPSIRSGKYVLYTKKVQKREVKKKPSFFKKMIEIDLNGGYQSTNSKYTYVFYFFTNF